MSGKSCALLALVTIAVSSDVVAQIVDHNSVEQLADVPTVPITSGFTGAWYDPAQSGQGLLIEILPSNRILAFWFTFDVDGRQAWFGGDGQIDNDVAFIHATQGIGGRWIPNFNPNTYQVIPWGDLTLTFVDCNHGRVDFSGNGDSPVWGIGHMDLTRLTTPVGTCVPDTPPPPPPPGNLRFDLSFVNQSSPEFARFKSFVDDAVANPNDPPYAFKASDAAQMFRITGGQQYQTLAIQLADKQVTEAEASIAAGGHPAVSGDSYLEVGSMIGEIATVYAWCPNVTTAQKVRWAAYANQTLFNVWNPNAATWGGRPTTWSGWSIDDPYNNYYYSFMRASMLWSLAANDPTIIKNGKNLRDYVTTDRLPRLVNAYALIPGGGSLEGTGYGTAHKNLFELYQWWKDSGGADVANANTHLTNTIKTWVHGTVPGFGFFHPTGDQSRDSSAAVYDYHRILMLWAVHLTNDAQTAALGSWWLSNIPIQVMNGFNSFYDMLPKGTGTAPADLTYRAAETGFTFARTSWASNATWLGIVMGQYNQSHAHKEQGGFTIWKNGWQAVTLNVFSSSGIEQWDEFNNVMRFERAGVIQRQREQASSIVAVSNYTTGPGGELHITGNVSPVYDAGSGVGWVRTIDFVNGVTTINDDLTLTGGTLGIWQMQVPTQPTIAGNVVTAGALRMEVLSPANAQITATRGDNSNFSQGWRIEVSGSSTNYRVQLATQ